MRIYGFLIVLAATLFGTASNVAKADVQQVIRDFKQGGPSERTVARLMLIGATTGLQAANTFLRDERKDSVLHPSSWWISCKGGLMQNASKRLRLGRHPWVMDCFIPLSTPFHVRECR
jgi:hypothetical protein